MLSAANRLRITPGRIAAAILIGEGVLFLSNWLGWWHKGYAVLSCISVACAGILLVLLWFLAALLFRLQFQFSLRSLLLLTLAVAVPCSWLAAELRRAKEQAAAL